MNSGQVSQFDRQTLMLTISLIGLGIVMLYSSSTDIAYELTGDHMYYLKRQLFRLLMGVTLFMVCTFFDYRKLKDLANALLIGSIILLVLTLVIHKATGTTGVARWLYVGSVSIQPSDLARFALVIYLAAYLDRKAKLMADFTKGLLPALLIIGIVMGLIVLAPDYSTAALTGFLGIGLLFMGGARLKHLLLLGLVTLPLAIVVLMAAPYRRMRILTYLGLSESSAADYQISQSLISLGNGGFLGQGLGNSVEKKLFLGSNCQQCT
jgi:cell division protein FtsW